MSRPVEPDRAAQSAVSLVDLPVVSYRKIKMKTPESTTEIDKNRFEKYGFSRGVLAISFARMADAIGNSILIIIIPLYVAELSHTHFDFPVPILVGILISIYGFVASIMQPIMGSVSDKLGRRKPLIQIGLLLMLAGTLTFMAADEFYHLLGLRIMQGIGVATTIPAAMAIMAAVTRRQTRGASMGVYSMLRLVGFSSGPILGGFLKVKFGFDAAFIVGGGFVLLAMIMVQLWVHDINNTNSTTSAKGFKMLDRALMQPGILSAAVATFLMAVAFSMVTTLENEFNAKLGMNALGFGVAFSMVMISRLIFQVPLGRLADIIGRKPLVLGGLLLLAPATALLGWSATSTQLIGYRFLQGIAGAGIAAPAFAVVGDLAKEGGEGRQMSVVTTGFGLGIAIGPLLAGLLSVVFFELPFVVAGMMCLGGMWVVYRCMPETSAGSKVWFKSPYPGESPKQ